MTVSYLLWSPRARCQGRGEDCALEEENSGTRYFPRFDVGDPTFVRFERYLCGIDGGSRSEKLARKMKMDVSKFLRYACGPSGANWERLLDRDQLAGYVEKLKRASVGPEGQLLQIMYIHYGVYLRLVTNINWRVWCRIMPIFRSLTLSLILLRTRCKRGPLSLSSATTSVDSCLKLCSRETGSR